MKESQEEKAALSKDKLFELPGFPDKEELESGPVAVIECPEEIACNVCEAACPFGAIEIGKEIIKVPKIDPDKCVGCGQCVSECPGLAVYVVDLNYTDEEALLTIPYEFSPLPKKGEIVTGVTRKGEKASRVKIVSVDKKENGTPIIKIAVPKSEIHEIRGILIEEIND
ncbi:4Fe-4S binding protein [Candidatus Bipolaricaulota bacterium]|nr:4Fe-4S binding protein [Candidatus Bipolaricaulota bacterium]